MEISAALWPYGSGRTGSVNWCPADDDDDDDDERMNFNVA